MAGRIVHHKGFQWEVWTKSFRMITPQVSPLVASYRDLTRDEDALPAMDDFIAIMNIGIDIHSRKRL